LRREDFLWVHLSDDRVVAPIPLVISLVLNIGVVVTRTETSSPVLYQSIKFILRFIKGDFLEGFAQNFTELDLCGDLLLEIVEPLQVQDQGVRAF
jgi:hypothetical protein